ncbi:alpha,alpha-trehalase nth1 [Entophlyctis luteolus]|nr:alpha,alpha-trehalase nth1 [Entophlyctis luteolus]
MLLAQEDTDRDGQITIKDKGPKVFIIPTANSAGFNRAEIRGTYALSNLLQELQLATDHNRKFIILSEDRLFENPLQRLERLIKFHFWDALTRRIDADGLEAICADPKNRQKDTRNRIYIPFEDVIGLQYFTDVSVARPHLNLDVVRMPRNITPQYAQSLNTHPGVLALSLRRLNENVGWDVLSNVVGAPFAVPGGRFNEQYGWDSYFESLGLIIDGRLGLAQGMADNFIYEIEHYGKILNANRSYYLTRSQPPFLTDMFRQLYAALSKESKRQIMEMESRHTDTSAPPNISSSKKIWKPQDLSMWLARAVRASIKELFSVWLSLPRLDPVVGLSKYHPDGLGVPPETEEGHFDTVFQPFADKLEVPVKHYEELYANGQVVEPELDDYFMHDRAVRESGHDTTYRFDGKCANLATVDLNCLVYKYETDLAEIFDSDFGGRVRRGDEDSNLNDFNLWVQRLEFEGIDKMIGGNSIWNTSWAKDILVYDTEMNIKYSELPSNSLEHNQTGPTFFVDSASTFTVSLPAALFKSLATRTHTLINKYLWSDADSLFLDYDCKKHERPSFETVTAMWALWAGVASADQSKVLIPKCLQLFEVVGGLVSTSEKSRGEITAERMPRQWDYPYDDNLGWAPHQIMAWKGLANYGHQTEAQRLAYRWLYTCVKAFVDFNGVVPEKFDVVSMTHLVNVEYGNVGSDFQYVVREGFGWMNASCQVGLQYLSSTMRRSLGALVHPNDLFRAK